MFDESCQSVKTKKHLPTLHVSNLPSDITKAVLYETFRRFGEISDVFVVTGTRDFEFKYGFVRFQNLEDCIDAMKEMDGFMMGDFQLKTDLARETMSDRSARQTLANSSRKEAYAPRIENADEKKIFWKLKELCVDYSKEAKFARDLIGRKPGAAPNEKMLFFNLQNTLPLIQKQRNFVVPTVTELGPRVTMNLNEFESICFNSDEAHKAKPSSKTNNQVEYSEPEQKNPRFSKEYEGAPPLLKKHIDMQPVNTINDLYPPVISHNISVHDSREPLDRPTLLPRALQRVSSNQSDNQYAHNTINKADSSLNDSPHGQRISSTQPVLAAPEVRRNHVEKRVSPALLPSPESCHSSHHTEGLTVQRNLMESLCQTSPSSKSDNSSSQDSPRSTSRQSPNYLSACNQSNTHSSVTTMGRGRGILAAFK